MTSDISSRVISAVLRLVFMAAATVFAVSLLVAVVFVVLVSLLWSLVTGRKPTSVLLWQRYREASARARWAASRMAPGRADVQGDVVDVQAREVSPLVPQKIQGQTPH